MWRALILLASLQPPTGCPPPPPPYECQTLPAEIDFGEVRTFRLAEQAFHLDPRDLPELSIVDAPFAARIAQGEVGPFLHLQFAPRDARMHVAELRVRLSRACEEQTMRLIGLGSGAIETPSLDLDFGSTPQSEPVELLVPFTNTRRETTSVSGTAPNSIELLPTLFELQPGERREVRVRLSCMSPGPFLDRIDFRTLEPSQQFLDFTVRGECLP
ncbi:MAG: hypothetical protein JNM17_01100 [Archangium sp.]|nr:hypothetical protein [Archangium sp.]